jgi:hypothetical protein
VLLMRALRPSSPIEQDRQHTRHGKERVSKVDMICGQKHKTQQSLEIAGFSVSVWLRG